MASPLLRPKPEQFEQELSSESVGFGLRAAERPEEVLPILLEELVGLGFPRALVLEVDLETGEVEPNASLNCDKAFLKKFSDALGSTSPVSRSTSSTSA